MNCSESNNVRNRLISPFVERTILPVAPMIDFEFHNPTLKNTQSLAKNLTPTAMKGKPKRHSLTKVITDVV